MKINFNELSGEQVKDLALSTIMEQKQVSFSTVDGNGNPISRIVDIMVREGDELFFITCNTKPFYAQLKANNNIALSLMTSGWVQVRVQARCIEIEIEKLTTIFEKNPGIKDLGLQNEGVKNLSVFKITQGKGELFDLSGERVKMQRVRFDFGGEVVNNSGCIVTDDCINCGACIEACPFMAISEEDNKALINPNQCNECGICYYICPADAILLPKGF